MYYKLIAYEKKFVNVETKKGMRKKVYFKKIATKHNIHKAVLSKAHLQMFQEQMQSVDAWGLVIDELREDEDERESLIYKNNEKVKKLVGELVYMVD